MAVCVSCGGGKGSPSAPNQPTTPTAPTAPSAPVPAPDEILVGAGDIGWCGSTMPEATAKLLDATPGAVFTSGDNVYMTGSPRDFAQCYDPSWGRHLARTHPAPGNHEYETPGASGYFGYFGYFGSRAGPSGRGYYSVDLGAWHLISLNSEVPIGRESEQLAWVRADLSASTKRCTVAIWHRPLFSSGPNGNSPDVRDLWRLLYEFHVEIVLNGHDHVYERFGPQDPDGRADTANGIRQFTVGTGGATLYALTLRRPNSEVFLAEYGVLKLTLRSNDYLWQFLQVGGSIPDSGTDTCR